MFYDSTYILVLIGAFIALMAQINVSSSYKKFAKVTSRSGMTGREVAERILNGAGLYSVRINHIGGEMTDNYDPRDNTLNLSASTYNNTSIAAIGIAAHECGHAIQAANSYSPLVLRRMLVPVTQFSSNIAWPLVLIGLLFNNGMSSMFLFAGIICFGVAVVFQLITLPVEFDASRRAKNILKESNIVDNNELKGIKKVLSAAALTYVAALAVSILNLLRIIALSNRRK